MGIWQSEGLTGQKPGGDEVQAGEQQRAFLGRAGADDLMLMNDTVTPFIDSEHTTTQGFTGCTGEELAVLRGLTGRK